MLGVRRHRHLVHGVRRRRLLCASDGWLSGWRAWRRRAPVEEEVEFEVLAVCHSCAFDSRGAARACPKRDDAIGGAARAAERRQPRRGRLTHRQVDVSKICTTRHKSRRCVRATVRRPPPRRPGRVEARVAIGRGPCRSKAVRARGGAGRCALCHVDVRAHRLVMGAVPPELASQHFHAGRDLQSLAAAPRRRRLGGPLGRCLHVRAAHFTARAEGEGLQAEVPLLRRRAGEALLPPAGRSTAGTLT